LEPQGQRGARPGARAARLRIQLRLPRKARKPIRRRLKHRKKLEANVTVVLKDAAGNSSTVKAAMRLRK
jgi:hypothetical protein